MNKLTGMTIFTSFSQNFEDVILWRVFKSVGSGFYIDVGANDPVVDSVSYALYQLGWRGIHVEPVPEYASRLRASRPDEIVVEAAISPSAGELVLYDLADTGLSKGRRNQSGERRGGKECGRTSRNRWT